MSKQILGAEIFATGTHNGLSFNESDLDNIVAAFDALGSTARVPLKFGHNNAQPMTDGQPALGWVQRVWRSGKKLLADFVDMPTIVHDAIGAKLYKQVSIELLKDYNRNGDSYPWVLDAVALLGADIPAVKGLSDLKALAYVRDVPGIRFASAAAFTSGSNFTTNSGDRKTMTEAEMQAAVAEANRKAADATKALEDERKARFAEKVAAHRTAVIALLDKSIEEGRILPRTKDRIVNARQFKSDEDVLTAYSMESVQGDIKADTRADFKEGGQKRTSVSGKGDGPDFSNMTTADVLTFRAQEECLRVGGKTTDFDDMCAASNRVLKSDKKLAQAYFSAPNALFASGEAA